MPNKSYVHTSNSNGPSHNMNVDHSQKFADELSSGWTLDHHPSYQAGRVASIVKAFLDDMNFVPSGINPVNKNLENYLEDFMHTHKLQCKKLERLIHAAASLVELAYYNCTLEEKKSLALFNWFALYIDDSASKNPLPFREFGSRFLRRQPQLDPVLEKFPALLDRMWDLYDPMAATAIFNYSLCFLMGSCIEPELEKMPLKREIERFPYYIRNLCGLSYAYALFAFSKSGNFDMMRVVQALPDMDFWINITNDLLSFHKEEMVNETGTYIYNRSRNDNKSRYETCAELVGEVKQASHNVYTILADDPAALKAWKTVETGYIEWHLIQERYHLEDLGIGL